MMLCREILCVPHEEPGGAQAHRASPEQRRTRRTSYPIILPRGASDRPARRRDAPDLEQQLIRSSTSSTRRWASAADHGLRRAQPPRQRDHEHPRGHGAADLLPGREGLALPQGRSHLGVHEREEHLARPPRRGRQVRRGRAAHPLTRYAPGRRASFSNSALASQSAGFVRVGQPRDVRELGRLRPRHLGEQCLARRLSRACRTRPRAARLNCR